MKGYVFLNCTGSTHMITGTCKHVLFICATVLNVLVDHRKDRKHVKHTASGDWKHELARGET